MDMEPPSKRVACPGGWTGVPAVIEPPAGDIFSDLMGSFGDLLGISGGG